MAWVKVPPENHPIFHAALPGDARVDTMRMFGGVAARVNGNVFAGLFGRSVMVLLDEPERAAALAMKGAAPFDPMGDGRARSEKVMLPERLMKAPVELRDWVEKAFHAAVKLPAKAAKSAPKKTAAKSARKKTAAKSAPKKTGMPRRPASKKKASR